jgi:hypothetical protein
VAVDPDHLLGVAALGQLAGDPLVDPGVEGREPDPDHRHDGQDHRPDHHRPAHCFLLVDGVFAVVPDAAVTL